VIEFDIPCKISSMPNH